MKDPLDFETQTLDLGDMPRRRGRPPTDKAMTNAQRQQVFRERKQKALHNDIFSAKEEINRLRRELELAQLATGSAQSNSTGMAWHMQYKLKGWKTWSTSTMATPEDEAQAIRLVIEKTEKEKALSGGGTRWRVMRTDGVMFDPIDCTLNLKK